MNESKATRYQRLRRRAQAANVASAAVMMAIVALTPAARWMSGFAHQFASGLSGFSEAVVSLTIFVVVLVVLWELAMLPALVYVARRVDLRYGKGGGASIDDVLAAQAQASVVALPAALLASATVITSVAAAGRWWWIAAAILLAALFAAAMHGAPVLLAMMADTRPIARPSLVTRLAALSTRANVSVSGIREWVIDRDASTTALVSGLGRSRHVLLSSELTRHWSDDEVAVVVAHELAHVAYRDLWRAFALNVLVLVVALFVADMALRLLGHRLYLGAAPDLAALPFLGLVSSIVWLLATPIRHAQSRRHERRADAFALALTGEPEAFGAAIRRLSARSLSEERPSVLTRWLYHRHPSVAERLAFAEAYQRRTRSGS